MNKNPQKFVSEQGEDMACGYPNPDMTKSNMGVECKGHGTVSDQRHTDLPVMGGKNHQYEIAHQPVFPENHNGRSGAHKNSLNRGKTGQTRARSPPVPLKTRESFQRNMLTLLQ